MDEGDVICVVGEEGEVAGAIGEQGAENADGDGKEDVAGVMVLGSCRLAGVIGLGRGLMKRGLKRRILASEKERGAHMVNCQTPRDKDSPYNRSRYSHDLPEICVVVRKCLELRIQIQRQKHTGSKCTSRVTAWV